MNMQQFKLFTVHLLKQGKKKWLTLFLLLLFPFFILFAFYITLLNLLPQEQDSPTFFAVVNNDHSEETKMLTRLLTSNQLLEGQFHFDDLSEDIAQTELTENLIAGYLVIPTGFTEAMYNGKSMELLVVGNDKQLAQATQLYTITEVVSRYLNEAQAYLLYLNEQIQHLDWSSSKKEHYLMEQFMSTALFILNKEVTMDEQVTTNQQATSPVLYFLMNGLLVLLFIWGWMIYHFFTISFQQPIHQRLRLLNVQSRTIDYAHLLAVLLIVLPLQVGLLGISSLFFDSIIFEDLRRLFYLFTLAFMNWILLLKIIERLLPSQSLQMYSHLLVLFILLAMSGAFLPPHYLPEWIQNISPVLFPYESLLWAHKIVIEERLTAHYSVNTTSFLFILCTLIVIQLLQRRNV